MFIRRVTNNLPKGIFLTSILFPKNIPSLSEKAMKVVKASFAKYPISTHFSPIPPKITSSKMLFSNKTSQVSSRSFSTTSQAPSNSLILEESLNKIKEDPTEAPKIIKSLPLETRKELALALVEKRPEIVANNIGLFEIEDEKTLKEIILKITLNIKTKRELESFLTDLLRLGIKDPAFIKAVLLSTCDKFPGVLLGRVNFRLPEEMNQEILLKLVDKLPKYSMLDGDKEESETHYKLKNLIMETISFYPENSPFIEKFTLAFADKAPSILIKHLQLLPLSEDLLKKVLLKIVENEKYGFRSLVDKLCSLGIKDSSFIKTIILLIADKEPIALLGSLNMIDYYLPKKIVQEIILKMAASFSPLDRPELESNHPHHFSPIYHFGLSCGRDFRINYLERLAKEVASLHPKDSSFTQKIALAICDKDPISLIDTLKDLDLPSDVLQKILTQILKRGMSYYDIKDLAKELPTLSIANLEEILMKILTREKVSTTTLYLLLKHDYFSSKISLLVFCTRWDFEIKELIDKASPSEAASLKESSLHSKKLLTDFFQKPEIQRALSQIPETPFKRHLLETLALLDKHPNISPIEKLEELITLCDVKAVSPPSLEELTDSFILFNKTLSHYEHVYANCLNPLLSLRIQGPIFFEAALALAKKDPVHFEYLIEKLASFIFSVIGPPSLPNSSPIKESDKAISEVTEESSEEVKEAEKFNISNVKALESIGIYGRKSPLDFHKNDPFFSRPFQD